MKLLILSQYFWPENFRINDVVEGLTERGHAVTVYTGLPNYPGGRYFAGYGFFGPLRERYSVELAAGGEWTVQGNIVDHEYEISGPGGRIAEVAKKWFRVRDTYGVEVATGQDEALVIAVAVVVDQMAHPGR